MDFRLKLSGIKEAGDFFAVLEVSGKTYPIEIKGSETLFSLGLNEVGGGVEQNISVEVFKRISGAKISFARGQTNDLVAVDMKKEAVIEAKIAKREVDEVLRAICSVGADKKGICSTCPYRDKFFEAPSDEAI